MSTTDPLWKEFRDTIDSGRFDRAEAMLRETPALLHMTNGIGETVLHFLAVENNLNGVSWLHSKGADVNTKNAFGQPVLFEVASLGYRELFAWFVEQGADTRAMDEDGNDLVTHLRERRRDEMADWISKSGY